MKTFQDLYMELEFFLQIFVTHQFEMSKNKERKLQKYTIYFHYFFFHLQIINHYKSGKIKEHFIAKIMKSFHFE